MEKYTKKLEYDKVINILSEYCNTYIGKELCSKLQPNFNFNEVTKLLSQTDEACLLLVKKGNLPLNAIPNINNYLKSLDSELILSIKGLLDIARFLKISREVKDYFFSDKESMNDEYELLYNYFNNLYSNPNLENNIFEKIIDEENVADTASSKLNSLRRNRRKLEQDIKDKLNSFIHSSNYSKYIMDSIITIRNDRYVIPIKEEYKNSIKGFIHDVSSSGSTVYIEPLSVFEINNSINNVKIEENIEIEKILTDLSNSLFPILENLKNNINILGNLDLIFAKAKYSRDNDCVKPNLNNNKYINLVKARHPLIDKNVVVPIDISVGNTYSSLIITGPNTGGKTASLKTVGLLLLMAYSGILIPCNESSSIYVFENIFADIGDEQSIQESLSTFSSHLVNIIEITNIANDNSLILLDELGSGTDPIEGANLAISILEYFKEIGCLVISTTHYSELKNYALVNEGFKNASFEFDLNNLKPTYKLLIGIPGKSNAFAISKKLGLNSKILERAMALVDNNDISIEELLKNIYDNKIKIEQEKEEIQKNLNQIESLRKSLEKDNSELLEKENDIINTAKQKAREILMSAKEEANDIIKELSNTAQLKNANNLRNKLNDSIKKVNTTNSPNNVVDNNEILKPDEISIGLSVKILPFGQIGKILTLPNKSGNIQVQIGNTKTYAKLENLRKSNIQEEKDLHSKVTTNKSTNFKSQNVMPEINVIGRNVEEAIFVIDKYLDDCSLSSIKSIRIVHGKGTGKLREGIHKFLKTNPHVKSYRLGTFGEGEMGVTVVELK